MKPTENLNHHQTIDRIEDASCVHGGLTLWREYEMARPMTTTGAPTPDTQGERPTGPSATAQRRFRWSSLASPLGRPWGQSSKSSGTASVQCTGLPVARAELAARTKPLWSVRRAGTGLAGGGGGTFLKAVKKQANSLSRGPWQAPRRQRAA